MYISWPGSTTIAESKQSPLSEVTTPLCSGDDGGDGGIDGDDGEGDDGSDGWRTVRCWLRKCNVSVPSPPVCDGPESGSDEKYNFVHSTNSLDTDSDEALWSEISVWGLQLMK